MRTRSQLLQNQLHHEKSVYRHLEHEYHVQQRNVQDLTRNLQSKDVELQHKEQYTAQATLEVGAVFVCMTICVDWRSCPIVHAIGTDEDEPAC